MSGLREYQAKALDDLRGHLRAGVKRVVMTAPTGAGKTMLAATIASGARSKGNKMAFVVPAISLIDQTVEMFAAEGVTEVGVMQAGHYLTDWRKPVQVCSIQTLRSRNTYPDADVVVFDECHQLHAYHKEWLAHESWRTKPIIGLSATPGTRDLGKHFQKLVIASTTKQLIAEGYLSKFTIYAPARPDLTAVRKLADDFHQGDLSKAMDKPKLVGDVVGTWQRLWGKDKTIVFACDLAHARNLADHFLDEGIRAGYQDASTPIEERARLKELFHSGEMPVVVSVGTMLMGVDWDVRCLVWARPTMSEMLYVQGTGRGLRTAEGKERLLILDHADNAMRLGFPDDILFDTLLTGKAKGKSEKRPTMPRVCQGCNMLMPEGAVVCPGCGKIPERRRNRIFFVEGELVEIDEARVRPEMMAATWTLGQLHQLYGELKGWAHHRRYKDGWIANKFRERTGGWPPSSFRGLPTLNASEALLRWLENSNARWKRQMRMRGR
jgi:superfamily II DNA or RNA helicase